MNSVHHAQESGGEAFWRDDAYFSAGCWIACRGVLLENYATLCAQVKGKGNPWEDGA